MFAITHTAQDPLESMQQRYEEFCNDADWSSERVGKPPWSIHRRGANEYMAVVTGKNIRQRLERLDVLLATNI